MSGRIMSFRELKVYRAAFELQQRIFNVTKSFPKEEMYSLTDQFRRSYRSVGASLAEAWQKRRYGGHFVSKLTDADGEQAETQHWIGTAFACQYITDQVRGELLVASVTSLLVLALWSRGL
ncbi:MAG: four helix bundle protein [Verrucomicrobiota bacterium]